MKHLSPYIGQFWHSIIFWRSLSLVLISVLFLAIIYRKTIYKWLYRTKIVEHDTKIFKQCDEILSEIQLKNILDLLGRDHSYSMNSINDMQNYCRFLDERQNQYLIKDIRKASNILNSSLNNLLKFLSDNFFFYPKDQNDRQCLRPYWNIDRGGDAYTKENRQKYEAQEKELYKYVDSIRKSYKGYRSKIKQNLFI